MCSSKSYLIILLTSALLSIYAYYPGFSGGFEFDDQANIVDNFSLNKNPELKFGNLWQGMWSSDSGPLGRPISMLTVAFQIATSGLNPYPMKVFNLIIHWMTGLVILFISLKLIRIIQKETKAYYNPIWLSAIIFIIWLVHPLNLTSVSYIIQRMNILSAFFTSLAILFYLHLRNKIPSIQWKNLLLFLLVLAFGILGVLSKENAILLPVYLLAIELFIFRHNIEIKNDIVFKISLLLFFLGAIFVIYIATKPEYLAAYQYREFTLEQRLLTECRVIIWYLSMLVFPDIRQMSLYHDDVVISTSFFNPITTLISGMLLVLLIVMSFITRKNYYWIGFGIIWFLGGHLLESTTIPLELVYEHRNYLPSFGIIFSIILSVDQLTLKTGNEWNTTKDKLIPIFSLSLITILSVATHTRAYIWSNALDAAAVDAKNHPQSVRANINAGNAYIIQSKNSDNPSEKYKLIRKGEEFYQKAIDVKPDSPNPLFGWIFMYYENELTPPISVVAKLKENLSKGLIDATTTNGLNSLTKCVIDSYCKFTDSEYLDIMNSALDNAKIANIFSSNLLRNLASFYAFKEDYNKSIIFTKRSIELNPKQIDIRLELIHYFANGGYIEPALKELDDIENKDTYNQYHLIISEWRAKLLELKNTR